MQAVVTQIGVIRSPFKSRDEIPIQSSMSDAHGEIEVSPEYAEGLDSLDGFSHIILLYWFHQAKPPVMRVIPYLDSKAHGLFSTRAPARPNPIGFTIVRLLKIEGNRLVFTGADMLDGTPLLDIKPFVPEFDNRLGATSGWLAESVLKDSPTHRSDDRFHRRLQGED
jgi:tRNA-Thr(GGU) m(6)t(6)A37 methyltransferase TsaA